MRTVFVKSSEIPFAGEGLWAKTAIQVRHHTLCFMLSAVDTRDITQHNTHYLHISKISEHFIRIFRYYLSRDLRQAGSLVALFNGVKQRHIWGVACQQKAWSDYR